MHFLNGLFYKVFREDKLRQTIFSCSEESNMFYFFFKGLNLECHIEM